MNSRRFCRLSKDKLERKRIETGCIAKKAQRERNDTKTVHLTLRDVFSEIEKFISEISPGLIGELKGFDQTNRQPPTMYELRKIEAYLKDSPENDNHPLDPDWRDLLPRGAVATMWDNKRFDVGIGRYQFNIRRSRVVDSNRVESLSNILRLRRKLGYAMNKLATISQLRNDSRTKLNGCKMLPLRSKINWMPALRRSAISSSLDESVRSLLDIIFCLLTYYTGQLRRSSRRMS